MTTKARIFRAFSKRGRSLLHTKTRRGRCFTGSFAINRRDAWRCTVGHNLHDPCFSSARAHGIVLCPRAAWERKGVRLKLTAALPRKYGNRRKPSRHVLPWGLELYDGRRCGIVTGATGGIGGQRANYACNRGDDWLWGRPNQHTQPWTIFTAPRDATSLTNRVPIRRAWM
jgi:hypothetical protein